MSLVISVAIFVAVSERTPFAAPPSRGVSAFQEDVADIDVAEMGAVAVEHGCSLRGVVVEE